MASDEQPHPSEHRPQDALDHLERRVFGTTRDQVREDAADGPADAAPAFEIDLDPEDQGDAASSSEGPG